MTGSAGGVVVAGLAVTAGAVEVTIVLFVDGGGGVAVRVVVGVVVGVTTVVEMTSSMEVVGVLVEVVLLEIGVLVEVVNLVVVDVLGSVMGCGSSPSFAHPASTASTSGLVLISLTYKLAPSSPPSIKQLVQMLILAWKADSGSHPTDRFVILEAATTTL